MTTMTKLLAMVHLLVGPTSMAFTPQLLLSRTPLITTATTTSLDAQKIGVIYGTSTGSTESVASRLVEAFGPDVAGDAPVDIEELVESHDSLKAALESFEALVVGTPTWNTGAESERSGTAWDEIYYGSLQDLKLAGKKVAVFGLGDQISYSENYADASGELHDVFQGLGCQLMGYTSQEGYEHDDSKAIRGELFCGLLCDEVNQEDLTEERVFNWVAQLKQEGILDGAASSTANASGEYVKEETASESIQNVRGDVKDDMKALELENAKLRAMLEENSNLLDRVLKNENDSISSQFEFTPHYNGNTKVTMWTSSDGRSCYYSNGPPSSP